MACLSPDECKGYFGYFIDVMLGLKMVFIGRDNLKAFLWWSKHRSQKFSSKIKVLLVCSTLILVTQFAYRFTQKDIAPLF